MKRLDGAEIVDAIVGRPALYFGNREGYLRELFSFQFGRESIAGFNGDGSAREPLFPEEFVDLVIADYPEPNDVHWQIRISVMNSGEKAEWEAFLSLWKRYRSKAKHSST